MIEALFEILHVSMEV